MWITTVAMPELGTNALFAHLQTIAGDTPWYRYLKTHWKDPMTLELLDRTIARITSHIRLRFRLADTLDRGRILDPEKTPNGMHIELCIL
jgi:hypothetical protein